MSVSYLKICKRDECFFTNYKNTNIILLNIYKKAHIYFKIRENISVLPSLLFIKCVLFFMICLVEMKRKKREEKEIDCKK